SRPMTGGSGYVEREERRDGTAVGEGPAHGRCEPICMIDTQRVAGLGGRPGQILEPHRPLGVVVRHEGGGGIAATGASGNHGRKRNRPRGRSLALTPQPERGSRRGTPPLHQVADPSPPTSITEGTASILRLSKTSGFFCQLSSVWGTPRRTSS